MKQGSSFGPSLGGWRRALALAGCLLLSATRLPAQGVLLQGIADVEAWSTDTGSNLLTRNDGKPGGLVRLQVWGAAEVVRNVVLYGQAEMEGGPASTEDEDEEFKPEIYQLGIRYSPSAFLALDAGKSTHPMSTFASRRFSTRNPLIGFPDGYTEQYPLIVQASGANRQFDYRIAATSLPLSHDGYVPEPGKAWRPVLGAGFTPVVGVRIGASYTWGPYLSDAYTPTQLHNSDWKSYDQRIVSLDMQFSKGYFELRGEHARSSYDVPDRGDPVSGTDTYIEAKYTFGPRFFAAARAERNNYPFIRSTASAVWVARRTDFDNAEMGVGYRISESSLLKFAYRVDKWHLTNANRAFLGPGGNAFAIQFSQSFDVMSLLARPE